MSQVSVDLSKYNHSFSLANKVLRFVWSICYWLLFRPFGLFVFNKWRIFILRIFGAKIGKGSIVYNTVRIWAPWNLHVGNYTCIGPFVECYNQGGISIGDNTTISQKSYLCASTHDYTSALNELLLAPISIEDQVWIAADAFIGPNVNIGQGVVVGARSAVFKSVDPWTIVGGNPAKVLKKRILK